MQTKIKNVNIIKPRVYERFWFLKFFKKTQNGGFTLAELAIVLLIVSLTLGGLLLPFGSLRDQYHRKETQQNLNQIMDSLLGFAVANGRLPCPATLESQGEESPKGGGICNDALNGFVPSVTLGLSEANKNGLAIDAFHQPIRYAVSKSHNGAFTTANDLKRLLTEAQASILAWNDIFTPDLRVCATGNITQIGQSAACVEGNALSNEAVLVLFSTGKNGGIIPLGRDELANFQKGTGDNKAFVSHAEQSENTENGAFDDLLIWLSPYVFYNRLIAAGKLP